MVLGFSWTYDFVVGLVYQVLLSHGNCRLFLQNNLYLYEAVGEFIVGSIATFSRGIRV
jgi:hypothetical protein